MNTISQKLETVFRRIEKDRMKDMPMCNPVLEVKAIGFDEWGEYYLGVMLTPWFMNLMLLPRNLTKTENYQQGSKKIHVFPSGQYEFVMSDDDELGPYQVCSLYSPVFDFNDQETAVETATMILDEVMQQENHDTISTNEKMIAEYWYGGKTDDIPVVDQEIDLTLPTLEERMETPISRRQLLRGLLPKEKAQDRGA